MELKGKRLLLLGGVRPMCEVVKEAHKLGVEVYVTDYLENSPAKQIADKSFMVSTTDVDAVVELCKREQIDGVFTGYTDSMLPYCKKICDKLGFPFWADEESIENCIDKLKFKKICKEAGLPTVPWQIATKENYRDLELEIEFPIVIKPVDNSGSRGVFKCFSKDEFIRLCEKSLSFSAKGMVMIERMMNCENEFSVYYMIYEGKAYLSQMGDRYVTIPDVHMAPLSQGINYPSVHLNEWMSKMESHVTNFFEKNNMQNGFCFFQGFYEDGQFYVHEIGYRLAGGFAYKYVDKLSGYNQVQQMIRYSLTGEMQIEEIKKSNALFQTNAMLVIAVLKEGVIGRIEGIEHIKKISGILEVCQLHFVGDEINVQGATARVIAHILCIAENKNEFTRIVNEIKKNLKVYDTNENNMLIDLIDAEKVNLFYE